MILIKMATEKQKRGPAAGVKLSTVHSWQMDKHLKWISYDTEGKTVLRVRCSLCVKYEDKLKMLRNFKNSFIVGITSIKKNAIDKHATSIMHKTAEQYDIGLLSATDVYKNTAIGRYFCSFYY